MQWEIALCERQEVASRLPLQKTAVWSVILLFTVEFHPIIWQSGRPLRLCQIALGYHKNPANSLHGRSNIVSSFTSSALLTM